MVNYHDVCYVAVRLATETQRFAAVVVFPAVIIESDVIKTGANLAFTHAKFTDKVRRVSIP